MTERKNAWTCGNTWFDDTMMMMMMRNSKQKSNTKFKDEVVSMKMIV